MRPPSHCFRIRTTRTKPFERKLPGSTLERFLATPAVWHFVLLFSLDSGFFLVGICGKDQRLLIRTNWYFRNAQFLSMFGLRRSWNSFSV